MTKNVEREPNETVPDFRLPGTEGDEIREYQLSSYTDKGAVVLVFYPFDFSPVCTEVLCNFRDAEFLTFTENVDVFGVSLDSCYAHQRFIEEYDLPFPLLSDTRGRITDQYGLAYDEWEHHEGVPKRALLTIDESRSVRYKWVTEDAYESPGMDALHQTVLSLEEVDS
ncbi:redoxin domain-containing protein [Haloarchaeobius salinus]|uniref:redoxin domain-containing protein n=1 Tax=Haloarchaeobius salinus TaxID=1198298 RepID=UPI00210BEC52|nr:redoxin domain-containing protein [Haloarchaeobius salinus]